MPEGDTLYRIAHRLRPLLVGQRVEAAQVPTWTSLDASPLAGAVISEVESRGKHLLIRTAEGPTIHSHLGMTGSWHAYRRGEPWSKPQRRAALQLTTAWHETVCFSPEIIEIISPHQVAASPLLQRLGPDLMLPAEEIDFNDILKRWQRHPQLAVGEAVMNQTIACGIGNIYKSESLFLAQIHPWRKVSQLAPERTLVYFGLVHKLMRKNRISKIRRTRFASDGPPLWVYGRQGEQCLKCGTSIQLRRQGDTGRTTYWCSECQPLS